LSNKIKRLLWIKKVVILVRLAAMLGVSKGDYVSIISPVGVQTPFGYMQRFKTCLWWVLLTVVYLI
jgi:hypothetical protein